MVEGDYALSSNNCQTDEILAAQSVVTCGRGGQGSWGGKCSEPCGGGVLRAAEGCRGLLRAAEGCRRPGSVLGHFFSHFRNTRAVESTWAADSHMPQHSNKS